jgi:hypothetical protein
MASRALRSRTVEPTQEDQDSPAGESARHELYESTEGLGSPSEPSELTVTEKTVERITAIQTSKPVVTMADPQPASLQDSDLKQMLAGFMEAIQQSHASLQESVRA